MYLTFLFKNEILSLILFFLTKGRIIVFMVENNYFKLYLFLKFSKTPPCVNRNHEFKVRAKSVMTPCKNDR